MICTERLWAKNVIILIQNNQKPSVNPSWRKMSSPPCWNQHPWYLPILSHCCLVWDIVCSRWQLITCLMLRKQDHDPVKKKPDDFIICMKSEFKIDNNDLSHIFWKYTNVTIKVFLRENYVFSFLPCLCTRGCFAKEVIVLYYLVIWTPQLQIRWMMSSSIIVSNWPSFPQILFEAWCVHDHFIW
jgi:hypothetical protein